MIVDGILYTDLETLQTYLATTGLSEYEKTCITNDFQGIPNAPVLPAKIVTPRQMRLALLATGTAMADVTALFDQLTEPTKSQAEIWWEYSVEFQRDNAFLNAIAPSLGFTAQMLDDLFALAETL